MQKWLVKFLRWALLKLGGNIDRVVSPPAYEKAKPYIEVARALASAVEAVSAAGTSGEYKRHVVYAQLIKKFPNAVKRALALAIELSLD